VPDSTDSATNTTKVEGLVAAIAVSDYQSATAIRSSIAAVCTSGPGLISEFPK